MNAKNRPFQNRLHVTRYGGYPTILKPVSIIQFLWKPNQTNSERR